MSHIILLLMVLLLSAMLVEPLAKKVHLPFGIFLVIVGFLISTIVTEFLSIDTGIRWNNLGDIIFNIILPIIVFQAALQIDIKILWANIIPLSLLSLPVMLVSILITATLLFYSINHPTGFPWIAALITGALLSATEPNAVLQTLKQTGLPKRLIALLEGEGILNGTTATLVFVMLVGIATNIDSTHALHTQLTRFILLLFGGLACGTAIGCLACLLMKIASTSKLLPLASIICAYTAFTTAEYMLHVSGIMAVLSSGMLVGIFSRKILNRQADDFIKSFWGSLSHIAESIIFLIAGITITLSMFTDRWLAIVLGIIAVIIARAVTILATFPILKVLPYVEEIPLKQQTILIWGGTKGAFTLALALSLPIELDYWYTIQSITYGTVLFTLFLQSTTIKALTYKLHIN